MKLTQDLVTETRLAPDSELLKLLAAQFGAKTPKLVLVFDEAGPDLSAPKVHVLYPSSKDLLSADFSANVVLADTPTQAVGDEVMRITSPDKTLTYCRIVNGTMVWLP